MADATIDRLKIEVESEAKGAASTIDDLTDKLGKLSTSIGKLDVSKLTSLKTTLHDIGALKIGNSQDQIKMLDKQIDMMVSNVSKRLSQDLIKSLDITNSKLAADTKDMCAQFLKLNKAAILDGLSAKQWEDYDATFESTAKKIAKSSQVLWADMKQDYEDFYEFFKSQGAIYIDPQIRSDWGDDWDNMRKKYASKFTTANNGNGMDSAYKELNEKWPQLFPTGQLDDLNLDDKTDQFKRLCDVLEQCQLAMNGLLETSERDLEGQGVLGDVQGKLLNGATSLQNAITEYFGADNYKGARQEYQKAVATAMEQQYSAGDVNMMGFDAISSSLTSMGNAIKKLSDNDTWETLNSQIAQMVKSAQGSESVETLAKGVGKLAQALVSIPKVSNFSRFADGLSELNKAETGNFDQIADSLDRLASSAANLSKSGFNDVNVKFNNSTGRAEATGNLSNDNGVWEYTGTIEGLEENTEELESETQKLGDTASQAFQKATNSANALMNGVTLIGLSIPDLMDALDSDDASKYVDNIKIALQQAQEGLSAAQNALTAGEGAGLGQDQLSRYMTEIDQYEVKIDILKDKLAELGVTDGMQQADQNISQYGQDAQNAANGIGQASQANTEFLNTSLRLNAIQGIFSGIKGTVDGLHSVFNGLRSAVNSITSAVQKVGSVAKSAFNGIKSTISGTISATKKLTSVFSAIINPVSSFKKLTGASNDTGKSFSQTGKHLLKLIGYSVGVRGLYTLFRKMRSAMSDSFDNLAQYSSQVNSNLSTLQSDLNQVKNSLSTAFAPVLNVIVPILDTLLSYLAAAITAIGQFFAALTGSSTYTKATKVATDYAASLDSTGSSASGASDAVDDLNGELQGFNELNNISVDDGSGSGGSGGSGGGSSAGDLFTTEEVTNEYADFADEIIEAWEKADFTEIGETIGTKLRDALDSIDWTEIQETAEKIGTSVATLINGFIETSGLDETVGSTVGELINTGIAGADAFFTAFHWGSLGTFIANALNSAVSTISWADFGQTIVDGLNGVFTVAATWTGAFDFTTLGESVATLVNTALSGITWSTAITAASNFGSGIAAVLNSALTQETFDNIGTTLAGILNTVVAGVYSLLNETNFKTLAENIASGINKFLEDVDFKAIGNTIGTVIQNALDFVSTLISGLSWEDVKNALQDLFKGIAESCDLSEAGTAIMTALGAWLAANAVIAIGTGVLSSIGSTVISAIASALVAAVSSVGLGTVALAIGAALVAIFTISKVAEWLADVDWNAVGQKISDLVASGIGAIGAVVQAGVELVKSGWETLTGWLSSLGSNIVSGAVEIAVGLKKSVTNWASDAWTALQSAGKTVTSTVQAAVQKASTWVSDAWTAIQTGAGTVTRTLKGAVEKASTWVSDAWTAATATAGNVTRTLKGAVEKASTWVDDAWTAATKTAGTVTRGIKSTVEKGSEWVEDAWTAATKVAGTINRAVKSTVEKGSTWVDDAWTAATRVAGTVVRGIKSTVEKGSTWIADAWTAATKAAGTIVRGVKATVEKGSTWVSDAWTAATKTAGTVTRAIKSTVEKGSTWVADAWTAATKSAGTITRAIKSTVQKGSSWVADAWSAACKTAATVKRTLQQSVKKGTWSSDAWKAAKMVGGTITKTVSVTLSMAKNGVSALKSLLGLATGGIVTSVGVRTFAEGGYITTHGNSGWLQKIPAYANGTSGAHGTMFVAGEAGPEVVGHIGGRTEVLNQSQLAAIMKNAVVGGIAELIPSLQAIYDHMTDCANALISTQLTGTVYTIADVTADSAELYSSNDEIVQAISSGTKSGIDNSDNGKNYIDKMDRMLTALNKISNAIESGSTVTIEVEGDSTGMFKVMQKEARNYTKRTGNLAFT